MAKKRSLRVKGFGEHEKKHKGHKGHKKHGGRKRHHKK
jgi:hypothetical protein